MKVIFSPYVENDLNNLFDVLIDKGYLSSYPYAAKYVDDLVDYIVEHIETYPHKAAPAIFSKYGDNLKYITYKSIHGTTWYILFETNNDYYLVTYITNSQFEGHLF